MGQALQGKVAIVTGASRGIGAAIARRFAAEGAKVVLVARTVDVSDPRLPGSLRETEAQIQTLGGECFSVPADLSDPVDRARIVPAAIERFGGVDIVVNNAAWARFQPTEKQGQRYTRLAFEINYFAPLEIAQQAIPSMRERGAGWVLNLSSATSRSPEPAPYDSHDRYFNFHRYQSPTLYGSTKAALERTSAGWAAELSVDNIAINTLAPVEAVASEGAVLSGTIDTQAHMEPVEAMAEAALQLCSRPPAQCSGNCVLSLPFLAQIGVAVRTLDGQHLLEAALA